MLNLVKKIKLVAITCLLLLPLMNISNLVSATTDTPGRLHFLEPRQGVYEGRSDLEILIWLVKDSTETDANRLTELDTLTDKQLEERFGKEVGTYTTDKEGKIQLGALPNGKYYVREKGYGSRQGLYSVPFLLEIPSQNKDIYIKTTINPGERPKGGYNFKKVSSRTNEPLKNARFKVTRQTNGIYEPVLQDDKVYIVSSAENGVFTVDNLDYGIYYLWEVDAPSGYTPLNKPVRFEVTGLTLKEAETTIPNIPFNPPPDILIPYTGDILFVVLLFGGMVLFSLGYRMTKDEN